MVKIESPILKAVTMMDDGSKSISISGTDVEVMGGNVEIEFGDMSTETDTPLEV